jgi:hypothetical protein
LNWCSVEDDSALAELQWAETGGLVEDFLELGDAEQEALFLLGHE